MVNKIKEKITKIILLLRRNRFIIGEKTKIIINTNKYFTQDSWIKMIEQEFPGLKSDWDLVFCNNKYDVQKHYPFANACFLLGNSSILSEEVSMPKIIYYPFLGLEFLANTIISKHVKIEQPPSISAEAIAEYCLSMAILTTRKLDSGIRYQIKRKWHQDEIIKNSYKPFLQHKIGILGVGKVGKVVAKYFKRIGCTVAGFDKVKSLDNPYIDLWYNLHELNDFLRFTDILIICLPLNKTTKNFIGKKELDILGHSSYLINISRGDILDEQALIVALKNKKIKGVVLDTFSKEPLSKYSEFYKLDNVTITPHISGNINLFVPEIQKDFLIKVNNYLKYV